MTDPDTSYMTKNYEQQGGARWVIGGAIDLLDGSTFERAGVDKLASLDAALAGTATVKAGEYTVVSGDDSAGHAAITTGLSSVTAVIVQATRSGKVVASDIAKSVSGGTLTVGDGSTYALTTGDVIDWIAIGAV